MNYPLAAALTALAVFCEENPHIIAKYGLKIQLLHQKSFVARHVGAQLKILYQLLVLVHRTIHAHNPDTRYDRLASVLWGTPQDSQYTKYLAQKLDAPVEWEQSGPKLVECFQKVFPVHPEPVHSRGLENIDWVCLGFQGADPTRDFRAAGELGLDHFYNFCIYNREKALQICEESGSCRKDRADLWYSVALASIHITHNLGRLLIDQPAYVYCILPENANLDILETLVGEIHNRMLVLFHEFWLESCESGKVKTVLDTDNALKEFEARIPTFLWALGESR